jgi:6-phospho-beta-glucosidase
MNSRRIAVVGGGSQFSVGLSESLIDYARDMLADTTVVLLDIHEEHLDIVHRYASQLAQAVGVDMEFEKTTDRRRAFDGADFILNTFRPGSHREQEQDETIPPKYGLQGNETVGIGGIFMACRVVPVLQEICADAQAMCPNAWIVNYTNPTQYVADAVRRVSDMRIMSLCDGYVDVSEGLAPLLGVDPEDITVYPGGSNHGMWVMRLTVKGEDGYPILRERLSQVSQAEIDELYEYPRDVVDFVGLKVKPDQIYDQFIKHHSFPFSLKLFEIYGLLPAPRYYWRYHLDQDAIIAEQRSGHYVTMAGFYMKHSVSRIFDGLDQRLEQASQNLQTNRREGGGSHGDLAVRVISAMVNDLGETFDVNVPNQGAISNLPQGAIVEVAATVDHVGPHPFAMGPLPKSVLGYQYSLILSQELAIDAALSGDRNDLLKAILAHPLIHSVDAAEKAMDELLALQADWLPQFHE